MPITDLFAVREDGVSPAVMAASGGGSRGFGGHVAAVALAAAYATVPPGLSIHHVHIEFLRPAIAGRPLRAGVRSFGDARSIGRRFVEVAHDGEPPGAIATATFHRRNDRGPEHQPPMPAAPDVAEVPPERTDPVEIRRVADLADPAHQQTWLRPRVRPLAAEPWLHDCALLFMSDYTLLWPDWPLYDQRTPSTSGGLGHAEGRMFSRSGVLLASVGQAGLPRPPRN